MSNNTMNNTIENTNIKSDENSWVDADLVFCIHDVLAARGTPKTREEIRHMAYALPDELVELLWNSVPIAARANLVDRTYANCLALGEAPEELNSSAMLREAVDRAIANAPSMVIPMVFKNSVYNRALKAPVRFVAKHHESFTDPVSSYATAAKYTALKDRKVLVLAHILGVLK